MARERTCAICSKPIRSSGFILSMQGEWFHIACRSRRLQLKSLEEIDRAQAARTHAGQLLDVARQRQVARGLWRDSASALPKLGACPFCGDSASLTDWRPVSDWIGIEDCQCGGFFIAAFLLGARVRSLTAGERATVARQIRAFRANGHEAWCTTKDGTMTGPLVIGTERPGPSSEPPTQA